jgi:hypothetical protein
MVEPRTRRCHSYPMEERHLLAAVRNFLALCLMSNHAHFVCLVRRDRFPPEKIEAVSVLQKKKSGIESG